MVRVFKTRKIHVEELEVKRQTKRKDFKCCRERVYTQETQFKKQKDGFQSPENSSYFLNELGDGFVLTFTSQPYHMLYYSTQTQGHKLSHAAAAQG